MIGKAAASSRVCAWRGSVRICWALPCSTIRPSLHDDDALADRGEDREVVADHHEGQLPVADESVEHVEHLGLHHDVERRGRLVGDDQLGVAGQGHRDHDPLPLPARELVRIGAALRGRQVDQRQQLVDPAQPRRGVGELLRAVQREGLGDLLAYLTDRVERVHRALEDDRRLGPPDRTQAPPAHGGDVLALQQDAARRCVADRGSSRSTDIASVDLPQPDSPAMPTVPPRSISRLTPSTATVPPA